MSRTIPPEAHQIVRELLSRNARLSTQEMFKLATANWGPSRTPALPPRPSHFRKGKMAEWKEARRVALLRDPVPYPDHPITSIRFLKRTVLDTMEQEKLITKVRVLRELSDEELEDLARDKEKRKRVLGRTIAEWYWQLQDAGAPSEDGKPLSDRVKR